MLGRGLLVDQVDRDGLRRLLVDGGGCCLVRLGDLRLLLGGDRLGDLDVGLVDERELLGFDLVGFDCSGGDLVELEFVVERDAGSGALCGDVEQREDLVVLARADKLRGDRDGDAGAGDLELSSTVLGECQVPAARQVAGADSCDTDPRDPGDQLADGFTGGFVRVVAEDDDLRRPGLRIRSGSACLLEPVDAPATTTKAGAK